MWQLYERGENEFLVSITAIDYEKEVQHRGR